jgi:hypothetical protein
VRGPLGIDDDEVFRTLSIDARIRFPFLFF